MLHTPGGAMARLHRGAVHHSHRWTIERHRANLCCEVVGRAVELVVTEVTDCSMRSSQQGGRDFRAGRQCVAPSPHGGRDLRIWLGRPVGREHCLRVGLGPVYCGRCSAAPRRAKHRNGIGIRRGEAWFEGCAWRMADGVGGRHVPPLDGVHAHSELAEWLHPAVSAIWCGTVEIVRRCLIHPETVREHSLTTLTNKRGNRLMVTCMVGFVMVNCSALQT